MRNLEARELLEIWEHGYRMSSPHRALALLARACPEASIDALTALPLGRRDELLQRLRMQLFGTALAFVSTCPRCERVVESTLDLSTLPSATPAPPPQTLQLDGRSITFRAPTLGDLIGLPNDPSSSRRALVTRCVADIDHSGAEVAIEALPEQAIDAIGTAMSAADPTALAEIALECPDCGEHWLTGFDITTYLWREIDAWAHRMLRDVHALARAYTWSEADVLALSPTRRQLYLELCRA